MAAPQRQSAQGPQKYPFNFRTGLNQWKWGGMIPDGDAGSIPPNRMRLVINGTYRFGQILARGGQRLINSAALHASDACVRNLFDFPIGTPRQLVILGDGCPDISASVGFSANFYDEEHSPTYTPGVYYDSSSVAIAGAVFGSDFYVGDDLSLRRYNSIRPPYGTRQLAISGSGQDTLIYTFSAGTNISAMIPYDGKLFVGVDNGGSSKIYYFDGVTIYDDDSAFSDTVQRFAPYRDKLIVGFDGSPNEIQVRSAGATPGSYSSVSPSAGTINFWRAASYKDVLYITTADQNLYSYNGSALTQIPIATTGLPANANTYGITVAFGNLYVAYEDVTGNAAKIASYDGTTWTPTAKNLTSDNSLLRAALDLIYYRGNLMCATRNSVNLYQIYKSPGETVSGTWTVTNQSSGVSGPINELLIF